MSDPAVVPPPSFGAADTGLSLDLGGGNVVTLQGVSSLSASDFFVG